MIDPDHLEQAIRTGLRSSAEAAVDSPNFFCKFVLRDEKTGKRIKQARTHRTWHELLTHYPRLVLWSHIESGKSAQISIGRTLWELGRNVNLRVAIVSKTNGLATNLVRAIGQYIEKSDELHEVFPHLIPAKDPSLPWTSRQLTIERPTFSKDPSIQACGAYGNIHGARIDLLIMDDIIDHTNTRTPTPRDSLWAWVRATLFGRLTDEARVWVIGNAQHPKDLMHRLVRETSFVGFKFPVITAAGEPTWPERWSHKRIASSKTDFGPVEFSRALLCQAVDDEAARFKQAYIRGCQARGQGRSTHDSAWSFFEELRNGGALSAEEYEVIQANETIWRLSVRSPFPTGFAGVRFYTGVDLAVSKADSADLTCLFTIAAYPNGDRQVVNVEAGRWSASEIMARIGKTYEAFGSTMIVENVGAQDYLVQILRETTGIPVRPFTTGRQKAHPEFGVEALAAQFASKKWIIPSGRNGESTREVEAWINELTGYDPRAHTGDRLMASWFAHEGARETDPSYGAIDDGNVDVTVIG